MSKITKLATSVFVASVLTVGAASQVQAQEYEFRLPHVQSATDPVNVGLLHFADLVEERSDGRIVVTVFPGAQLGTNQEMFEQVRLGAPMIILADPGYLSDYVPDFGVLNGPYLLDQPKDFSKILASDWFAGMTNRVREETEFELLTLNWFFGDRNVISNQPVRSVADFDDLSIRVPPNVMWIETFDSLGARGEQIAWSEVYGALATGVVDAAEAPLGSILAASLQENGNTISMTGHFYSWIGLMLNQDLFETMPEDLQEILLIASIDAGNYMTELVLSKQAELRATLEEQGVTFVTDVDRAGMRAQTRSVYDAFPKWTPGLYDTVRAVLK